MSWQDLVLTGGQIVFIIALLPSVFGKDKPAFSTSVLTTAILTLYAVVYLSLSLWFSFFAAIALTTTWGTLALQKYKLTKKYAWRDFNK